MAEHIGARALGGPVVATGNQQKLFDGITIEGEAHAVDLIVSGKLLSTGAAFNASNPSGSSKAARGADDVDKVLDGIFTNISLRLDEKRYLFQNELASRIRTAISALTARDVQVTGALVDGTSIPISTGTALAFTVRIPAPLSLRDDLMELDGDAYKQGTEALKKGGFFPNILATSGNIVLVNGTAVLSALALDTEIHIDPAGDRFYSGPSYKVETRATGVSEVTKETLKRAKRLLLIVDSTTGGPYTQHGDVERDTQSQASVADEFNRNRRRLGGDNTSARGTVVIFPRRGLTLAEMDLTPTQVYLKDTSANNITTIDITHEPVDEEVAARVKGAAVIANKGAAVSVKRPTPPSAAGSNAVHTQNASILGRHITPAKR